MMNRINSNCRRAFTLVEIMVALAIFSIVVAAIYSTWMLLLHASATGQEAAAQAQRERIAIRTIEDSLTCVQSFQASMKYYTFDVTNGDEPFFSYTAHVPAVFPRNGKFIDPATGRDFSLRRLTFQLEPGADSEKDLVLRQNPVLMDMDADEQNYPLILAHNVKSFAIECWDTNQAAFVSEWDYTNSIPSLVRVELTFAGNTDTGGSVPDTSIVRDIAIPSSTLPSVAQTGQAGPGGSNPTGIKLPGQR